MKNLNIILIALLISFTSCQKSKSQEKSSYKKYPFKSAIIEYKVEGNSTGTKTTYIDDYGYKQADISEITTTVMGFKTTEKQDVIIIGSNINTIDHDNKTVTTTNNPYAKKYAENIGEDYIKTGEEVLTAMGFTKSGTETVLGKECTIWKGMNTIWAWKGLVLKSETNMMGIKIVEVATSIKTDVSIPSNKFELPKNYTTQQGPNIGGMNDLFEGFDDNEISDEERQMMQDVKNMSFEDFKKMMKKEDPEVTDEEIRNVYNMMKKMGN